MEWNIQIGKNRGVATNWCKWNIMWRNMCFLFWIYILYTNCIINIQPQAKLHEMALGIICSIAATYRAPPNNYWSRFILSVMVKRTQKLAFSMKTLFTIGFCWFSWPLFKRSWHGLLLSNSMQCTFLPAQGNAVSGPYAIQHHGFVNDEYLSGTFSPPSK